MLAARDPSSSSSMLWSRGSSLNWLVVDLPSETYESQLGRIIPYNYYGKNVWNHQPVNEFPTAFHFRTAFMLSPSQQKLKAGGPAQSACHLPRNWHANVTQNAISDITSENICHRGPGMPWGLEGFMANLRHPAKEWLNMQFLVHSPQFIAGGVAYNQLLTWTQTSRKVLILKSWKAQKIKNKDMFFFYRMWRSSTNQGEATCSPISSSKPSESDWFQALWSTGTSNIHKNKHMCYMHPRCWFHTSKMWLHSIIRSCRGAGRCHSPGTSPARHRGGGTLRCWLPS